MSTLSEVRENFRGVESRGWFLPDPEGGYTGLYPPSQKGGAQGYRKAAVLCVISSHQGKLQVLLTKRSENVSFRGQTCFPGGTEDTTDSSLIETALREAEEEINLVRTNVEVICTLPPQYTTLSGLTIVTAVIALLKCTPDQLNLSPNPHEVESFFWVPLEVFLDLQDGTMYRKGAWWIPNFRHVDPDTGREYRVWGFTGVMCAVIAAIALGQSHSYKFEPLLISALKREGEMVSVTFSRVALPPQTATIPSSKL